MKQCLFIILFFTGLVPFNLSVPRKYYLIQEGKSWSDAQDYCRTHHTDLAIVQSNDNIVRLQDEIQKEQFTSDAWIGLYREITNWYWTMGNDPPITTEYWRPNEPDNSGIREWCGAMKPDGWLDAPCTITIPVVCFDNTTTGNQRYIYISTLMTWYEAQAYCRSHYTDLASARDSAESSIIAGLTSGNTWFGLVREIWKWTDQTNFSTISWMSGEPNVIAQIASCGFLNNGQAADELCSEIFPFLCYRVITGQQQIMRMEVRSEKDVNNPAVMDSILEQVRQKLKVHGLAENVTVKWRVQQDGKVFYKKKQPKSENKQDNCIYLNES